MLAMTRARRIASIRFAVNYYFLGPPESMTLRYVTSAFSAASHHASEVSRSDRATGQLTLAPCILRFHSMKSRPH
jgi:hypothetical protein